VVSFVVSLLVVDAVVRPRSKLILASMNGQTSVLASVEHWMIHQLGGTK
jgi:hypothetical protein